MRIFDIYNNEPRITPEGLFIPEMRAIWNLDKSEDKHKATSELLYVYHMADLRSPYSRYTEEEKEHKIIEDYFVDKEWQPSDEILDAITKYKEMFESVNGRLLKGVEAAMDKLSEYLKTAEIEDGSGGNLNQIVAAISKAEVLVNARTKLAKIVSAESEATDAKFKGGVKPSSIL